MKRKGVYVFGDWGVEFRQDGGLPGHPYDEEFIVRKRNALRQQGISLLTIEVQAHDINIH